MTTTTTTSTAYESLLELSREASVLQSIDGLLGWDQETTMPSGGAPHRAKQLALLATLKHERRASTEMGDLIAQCEDELDVAEDTIEAANLRRWRRDHDRAIRLPASLVGEQAETASAAQHEWAEARKNSDFARFLPWLTKTVELAQRQAEYYGWAEDGEPWDALAEDYEPGCTAADVAAVFTPLRARLKALLEDLMSSGAALDDRLDTTPLPADRQMAFVRSVAGDLGFDFERGRLDRSTHPFCGGSHCDDVRMTTRFHDAMLTDALSSTMHEAGHGLYDYRARSYDPELGRFLQGDTLIPDLFDPQQLNPYSYVTNSPQVFTDPTGHSKPCEEYCGVEELSSFPAITSGTNGTSGSGGTAGGANQSIPGLGGISFGFVYDAASFAQGGLQALGDIAVAWAKSARASGDGGAYAEALTLASALYNAALSRSQGDQKAGNGLVTLNAGKPGGFLKGVAKVFKAVGKYLFKWVGDDIKGIYGAIVSKIVLPFRGLLRIGGGLLNSSLDTVFDGIRDFIGIPLPSYGATTGWAWPGREGNAPYTPVVDNILDGYASDWHDGQDIMGESAAQFGWITKAWTGRDGKFSFGDVFGIGPYGQAVRAAGTVGFATVGVVQRGLGL